MRMTSRACVCGVNRIPWQVSQACRLQALWGATKENSRSETEGDSGSETGVSWSDDLHSGAHLPLLDREIDNQTDRRARRQTGRQTRRHIRDLVIRTDTHQETRNAGNTLWKTKDIPRNTSKIDHRQTPKSSKQTKTDKRQRQTRQSPRQ